jgi:hypothetical protein
MPKPKWLMNATLTDQGKAKDPARGSLHSGIAVYTKADLDQRMREARDGMRSGDVSGVSVRPITD